MYCKLIFDDDRQLVGLKGLFQRCISLTISLTMNAGSILFVFICNFDSPSRNIYKLTPALKFHGVIFGL